MKYGEGTEVSTWLPNGAYGRGTLYARPGQGIEASATEQVYPSADSYTTVFVLAENGDVIRYDGGAVPTIKSSDQWRAAEGAYPTGIGKDVSQWAYSPGARFVVGDTLHTPSGTTRVAAVLLTNDRGYDSEPNYGSTCALPSAFVQMGRLTVNPRAVNGGGIPVTVGAPDAASPHAVGLGMSYRGSGTIPLTGPNAPLHVYLRTSSNNVYMVDTKSRMVHNTRDNTRFRMSPSVSEIEVGSSMDFGNGNYSTNVKSALAIHGITTTPSQRMKWGAVVHQPASQHSRYVEATRTNGAGTMGNV